MDGRNQTSCVAQTLKNDYEHNHKSIWPAILRSRIIVGAIPATGTEKIITEKIHAATSPIKCFK
jgi:hypothetical protein